MNRRAFLASLVAAIAGLFRKPPAETGISIRTIRRCDWDPVSDRFITQMDVMYGFPGHSLFNPRENLHAQWLQAQHNMMLNAQREVIELLPAPIAFNPHFGVDFEWDAKELAA